MTSCPSCGFENLPGARFCSGCGALLAEAEPAREERKVVTVLFADLVGFTSRAEQMDPEDVRGTLGPYHARLRAELERFGGTVEKFIGDAAMALFGAPVAHEDDPERAVRAALAIREAIAELNEADPALELQVRIGVNTGEALVALGARPSEGEGMAAGDVVNTAQRLQAAARVNGILVGETTYRATQQAIEYREAEPVRAKGKAEPIPVWEALAPRWRFGVDVAQRGAAELVGRRAELDLLLDALARARRERAPQLVTLVGVPGIGKSRLVSELFAAVDADPELIYWRQGRCLPYGDGVTFWALAEMAKAQAGILETDTAEAAAAKLRQAVAEAVPDPAEAGWVDGQLRPLLGLGGEAELSGDRRGEAFAAWRRFFEALAERRPLVLVFEDLQWADEGVLDFVDYLVEWASGVPLLVVSMARPELLERRPDWGGGKLNAVTLSLSPLSEEETALLVAALLEQAVLPAEVQAALLARAEGNPLYAEEYVRMFLERGSAEDLPLPETVQGIVAARLDALSAEEKELLQDAAVVGKVFWAGALATIGELPRWSVEERLHTLERKEFVRRERRSSVASESEFLFRHALVRDVAYGQIPRARRAEKHRLAAEWIESLGRSEDHAEMLAHHYLAALEFARAAGQETAALAGPARVALREAGDRASGLHSYSAAARFYATALELWPEDDRERARLLLGYGLARWMHEQDGGEILSDARDALLAAGDREPAAEAEVWLANVSFYRGQRDRVLDHLERARSLVADAPPSRSKALVLGQVSRFHMLAGESEKAIEVGRQALEMAEALGLEDLRAAALNAIGTARVSQGDLTGLQDLERAIAIAAAAKHLNEEGRAYNNLSACLETLGDLRRSFEVYARAAELAERVGGLLWRRFVRGNMVHEHYWRGSWDEALRLADEFVAEAAAGSPHYHLGGALATRGLIRLARGDRDGASRDAAEALAAARGARDPQILHPVLGQYAFIALLAGRKDEAAAAADELLGRSDLRAGKGLIELAWVLYALGRGTELAERAAGLKPPSRWIEAAEAVADGDLVRAAEVCAEMGAVPEEAFCRLQAAKAGDLTQLERALAFYRSVGASAYVREGEALLAASA